MNTATPFTCIVADDDEIDRLTTMAFVKQFTTWHCTGVYASATQMLQQCTALPDIMLLDVDMPDMTGLTLRKQLMEVPACVFITAYPDYAVESFALEALDYLVKPIKQARFLQMVQRIESFLTVQKMAHQYTHSLGANALFIKEGISQVKVQMHEIIYLEAMKDYTRIITASGSHMVLSNIGALLLQSGFQSFVRVHKSYAIQPHFISSLTAQSVTVMGHVLPLGRAYKSAVHNLVSK